MVFASCFALTGCLGGSVSGGGGGAEMPDDLKGTIDNADEIMKTKDNVTYYYENMADLLLDQGKDAGDRNNIRHAFGDAYVFVDPGAGYQVYDHYSESTQTFETLVDRQIVAMSDVIYTAINRIYIDGTIAVRQPDGTMENLPVSSTSYDFGRSQEGMDAIISDSLDVVNFDDPDYIAASEEPSSINLQNIFSFSVLSGMDIQNDWRAQLDLNGDGVYEVESHILNLAYAPLGGFKLEDISMDVGGETKYYSKFYDAYTDDSAYFNFEEEYAWKFWGFDSFPTRIEDLQESLKEDLKMVIAAALSGIETEGSYDPDEYNRMLNTIDHLGYTETDLTNIKNQILDNIIGQNALKKDEENFKRLKGLDGVGLSVSGNKISVSVDDFNNLFENGGDDGQYYKGYEVVIDAIVDQAINLTHEDLSGTEESETLFPELPRVEIFKMDSWDLMDYAEEESEESEESSDEVIDDPENVKFTEKFGKFQKIVGILLMPKHVYGERTLAVKENGEWVTNEDGSVKLKTEIVEGFILIGAETVFLTEPDKKNVTLKVNYEVHTAEKTLNTESEITNVYPEKPEPTDTASYTSTTTIDVDKQEIISNEESVIKGYRIKGYDGYQISGTGEILDNLGESKGITLGIRTEGESPVFQLSTALHKYLGIADVNGDAGTNFAGYLIDVSKFAGNNYVISNIPILAVNDDEQNRDAKLEILYYYLDTN